LGGHYQGFSADIKIPEPQAYIGVRCGKKFGWIKIYCFAGKVVYFKEVAIEK
jgi:hypothetical protein